MTNNPAQPRKIDIYEAIERKIKLTLNCVQVGVVQSFDVNKQLATVKIAMKQVTNINATGVKTLQEYPVLLECPTFILSGGSDFISMPIKEGDNCLVLFNDRDIDTWLYAGDGGIPTTTRTHDLSDGFCLVGVNPLTKSIASYLADGIRISHNENEIIDLTDDLIESTALLFRHNGNMRITGGLAIDGTMTGNNTGNLIIDADLVQNSGREIRAGNGANGTFTSVTVVDGIVISGT